MGFETIRFNNFEFKMSEILKIITGVLDYAGDIRLLSSTGPHLRTKTARLSTVAQKAGLKITAS